MTDANTNNATTIANDNDTIEREVQFVDIKIKRNKDQLVPHELSLAIDYTDVDRKELISRAMKTDVIRLQANYRKMAVKELDAMELDMVEVDATTIGIRSPRKQKTKEQLMDDIANGPADELAATIAKLQAAMEAMAEEKA